LLVPSLVVRRKNHPCSAFRAEDARANNAIGHNAIIGSREPLHRRMSLCSEKRCTGSRWFSTIQEKC
jgi:hypothetical protein